MLVLAAVVVGAADVQQEFRLTREEFPAISGSTSTQPLGVLIASRVTGSSVTWQKDSFFGGRRLVFTDDKSPLFERVFHHGTSQSYARLAEKQADLVLTAREPTPEEREAIKKSGANPVVVPIARDAFVFLRNAKNPVKNLTLDQVRDIYAGTITNWQSVGGPDRGIIAYQREVTSGSQVEMESVMRGRKMITGPDIRMVTSMFGPFNALRSEERGIGYSYHYYERFMGTIPEVTTFTINGVEATPDTIRNGKYPLVTNVYLVHRSDLPAKSAAARLRDWIRSSAGQAVVEESGYVSRR